MKKIGKYEVTRLLGKGSSSRVYLAYDPFAQRHVALKCFSAEAFSRPDHARAQRNLLLTEAALAGKLVHPHIVQIFDASIGDNDGYIAMEYIAGGTLEDFCKSQNLLSFPRLVEILFKCTRALEYAFRQGITHRDIKPANILLTSKEGSEIKISDFGAAILHTNLERTQVPRVGSPAYMSPEQVRDEPLTHQTDIYSLGATMYQLLTGHLPFEGDNQLNLAYQIIREEVTPPSHIRTGIPLALERIVLRAMQKKQEARYLTWQAFAHDLVVYANSIFTQKTAQPTINGAPVPEGSPDTERFQVMRAMPFFKAFDDVEIWEALRLANWRIVPAHTVIMQSGIVGDGFALLARGQARIQIGGRTLYTLQAGECFGEMALFRHSKIRHANVISDKECLLIEIDAAALNRASSACQMRFYRAFLGTLSERLVQANSRVNQL